jgi:hypothetical protein
MKTKLKRKIQYACVPAALFGGGLIFSIIFGIITRGGIRFGMPARFALALFLCLLGMFLLRRIPKRTLIVSCAIACVIVAAVNLLWLAAVGNSSLVTLFSILDWFRNIPNNIVFPLSSLFSAGSYAAAIIFTIIEALVPMVYAFSGVFDRIAALLAKNTDNN